jgi:predicted amidohydrolase
MTIASAIQMTSTPDVNHNMRIVAELIYQAAIKKSKLVVLPEMFPMMGAEEKNKFEIAEIYGSEIIQNFLSEQARKNNIWIVGGTIPIATQDPHRVRAACIVYNEKGEAVARYDKMHLFDVCITEGVEEYLESLTVEPGDEITVLDSPIGKLGIAVCYDLRFPELFRNFFNQGVQVFVVPTAFTVKTGEAHWEVLARSRAIENLSYAIYACQTGSHSPTRTTYGHSMIVDPWGRVIAEMPKEVGIVSAEIDLSLVAKLRTEFPVGTHQRIFKTKE